MFTECNHVSHIRLGPRELTEEEQKEQSHQLSELIIEATRRFKMPAVRGKFTVVAVTNRSATSTYVEVELSALYSDTKEDNSYSSATPSGKITMTITNPDAVAKLPIGGKFYVDFTPVE